MCKSHDASKTFDNSRDNIFTTCNFYPIPYHQFHGRIKWNKTCFILSRILYKCLN